MYDLSQDILNKKSITELIDRWGTVISVTNDRTQFNVGQKLKITGKEGGSTFRVITKKGKTGYVETCDFELLPATTDEFELAKEDLQEEIKLIERKIAYFKETEAKEFNEMHFTAWSVVKAMKDKTDEKELTAFIINALTKNSTVTS